MPGSRKKYNNEGLKHCYQCDSWKNPKTDFGNRKDTWDGKQPACRACRKHEYQKPYTYDQWRDLRLKSRYGMTLSEYNTMLEQQDNVCAICKNECSRNKYLSVDHCHVSKVNRALLCGNCNSLIGFAKEDPIILDAALMYIVTHKMRIQEDVD